MQGEWQSTKDNPPPMGFYLAHEGGAIRTMWFDGKVWELPDFPVLILQTGDRLVPRDVEKRASGEKLGMCQMITDPTHWMPLPEAPQ